MKVDNVSDYSPEDLHTIKVNAGKALKINRTIAQLEEKIALAKRVRSKYLKRLCQVTRPREIFMVEMEDGSKYRFQVLLKRKRGIYYIKEMTRGFKGNVREEGE